MTRAALALDIGGTRLKSGLVDGAGAILTRGAVPSDAAGGRDALLAAMDGAIRAHRAAAADLGLTIAAIGIGTAGYVDRSGRIAYATDAIPGWTGFDLQAYAAREYGLPAVARNDAAAIAAGEAWLGAGAGYDRFLCAALGTGIGGCLWSDGEAMAGSDGIIGAIGHQAIEREGRLCACGQRGCWEAYASVSALKSAIATADAGREPAARWETPLRLFADARSGDPEAEALVDAYADEVAVGLANLVNALGVRKIVVAGAISQQGFFLTDRIRRHVVRRAMPLFADESLEIVPAALGDDAGVVGAAWSVRDFIQ